MIGQVPRVPAQARSRAAGLITRAAAGPVLVITLTDEELAALDGAPPGSLAPQPWLAALDEPGRLLACQVALRGLAARGLAVPAGPGPGGSATVAIHEDLRAALDLRRTAPAVVTAQRRSGRGLDVRVLHLHHGGLLEEGISPGGLHTLTVTTPSDAARRLAGFADPGPAAGDPPTQPPQIVPLADIAAGPGPSSLTGARYVTTVSRLNRGTTPPHEQRLTIYALPGRVRTSELAATGGPPALAITQLGGAQLRERLATLLAGQD